MKIGKQICLFLVITLLFVSSSVYAKVHMVTQNNKQFLFEGGHVAKFQIRAGDSIKFLNEDKLFHNIFSMSKIMKFNIGSYGTGESEVVVFNKTGVIAVECGIHPRMMLEVDVAR